VPHKRLNIAGEGFSTEEKPETRLNWVGLRSTIRFCKNPALRPGCYIFRVCDPLATGIGFGIGFAWPLGGPWVELKKYFCLQQKLKKAGYPSSIRAAIGSQAGATLCRMLSGFDRTARKERVSEDQGLG
jgi:hypothetical protein